MIQVKVGVIGSGRMGQQHCRIYSGLRRAQLAGVCDINPELGRQVAKRFDVPFFRDVDDLLSSVEAVSLTTPTPYHYDLAMKCIQNGIPVLVEKPVTVDLDQAEALVRAAEESRVVVQVGHIERFNPAYVELKNVLGEMTPLAINFRRLSAYAGSNTDVDVVQDLMIHDADLVLDLLGREPDSITASGISAYGKAIDHAVVHLHYGDGPLVTLTASRLTEEKIRSMEVTALEAYMEGNLLGKTVTIHRRTVSQYVNTNRANVKYRQESIIESVLVPVVEPLLSELQHFVDCVIEHKPPMVQAKDGMKALKLVMDIRRAMQEHVVDYSSRPVKADIQPHPVPA